jgi:hypothetical protein
VHADNHTTLFCFPCAYSLLTNGEFLREDEGAYGDDDGGTLQMGVDPRGSALN